ncbi:MAG: restriction endonuclease [Rikenellaceae bacterium]
MTNYDFSTLNDKDLEDLMCELLSSELSLRLQKFKSGKDGGVDLRYSTNSRNNSIVVQVKHYAGSGYKALLRELEKERVKIEKLETVERYIIATSVPLSPQNKDVIKSLLAPYVLSTSDIFGKEDINTLLTKFPYIEKNSYKLWLSSVNVMQTVLHNAVQGRSAFEEKRIRKNLSLYVITKDYNKALNILRVDKMLLISGMPGIGKTSLANLITYYVLSRGFQLVYIDDIREAEDLFITDNSKQLFYFDDFLGSNYLDIVHGNKSRSIVNFVDRIKESKNKFLILTTRSTILNQAKASDEKIGRSNISSNKCEIVIENYSDLDKAKILYNHLYHSDIEKSLVDVLFKCKRYWKIIKHKNYNPRLIEFFCKKQNGNDQFTPETYYEFVINTLDHPALIWERAINTQLNEEEVLLLHTLFSFGQSSVSQTQLESAYDRRIDYEVKNNGFKRGFTIFDKAFSNLLDGYIANYCCPVNLTAPHNNPSEMYPKYISDGFFI